MFSITVGAVRGLRAAVGASYNVFVIGTFDGPVGLGGGPLDPSGLWDTFVVELAPGGEYVWAQSIPNATLGDLALGDRDDVFLEGMLLGQADFDAGPVGGPGVTLALASLSTMGAYRWAKSFPILGGAATGAVAIDGPSVIFTGGIGGASPDFGCGPLTNAASASVFLAAFAQ